MTTIEVEGGIPHVTVPPFDKKCVSLASRDSRDVVARRPRRARAERPARPAPLARSRGVEFINCHAR
tara:strand:- start:1063 stop:1263 length:201 start_codon:yes stop_codon:yes gene_type:complete